MKRAVWATVLAILSTSGMTAVVKGGQVRRQAPAPPSVSVKVSLKVDQQFMISTGPGTCTHAPKASIYNVPSEMWTVRQEAETRSTQLTVWRPTDGKEEMFVLSLSGARNVDISTVRGGTISGSGTVRLEPGGMGGTFTIDAKTKGGVTVAGTIECSTFTPAIAEGG
jgi:hypothetical protein